MNPPEGDVVTEVGALWTATVAPTWSGREWLFSACDIAVTVMWQYFGWSEHVDRLAVLLLWGHRHQGNTRGKRSWMDVDAVVATWHQTLVELATAHDHAGRTAAEARMDELLAPIKSAPVEQLRSFTEKLTAALESDPRVPFLMWATFRRVILPILLSRPAGEEIVLKQEQAEEIAQQVVPTIPQSDWVAAIAGALQWRSGEQLAQVKKAVEAGNAPRVRGRQSCLFLSVEDRDGAEIADVLL